MLVAPVGLSGLQSLPPELELLVKFNLTLVNDMEELVNFVGHVDDAIVVSVVH